MYGKWYLNGSINPFNGINALRYKIKFKKEHPEYFEPSGLLTFSGDQRKWKNFKFS